MPACALTRLFIAGAVGLTFMSLALPAAYADEETRSRPQGPLSTGFRFTESTAKSCSQSACQGCHMPDGTAPRARANIRRCRKTAISKPVVIRFTSLSGTAGDAAGRHHDERRPGRRRRQLCAHAFRQRVSRCRHADDVKQVRPQNDRPSELATFCGDENETRIARIVGPAVRRERGGSRNRALTQFPTRRFRSRKRCGCPAKP